MGAFLHVFEGKKNIGHHYFFPGADLIGSLIFDHHPCNQTGLQWPGAVSAKAVREGQELFFYSEIPNHAGEYPG